MKENIEIILQWIRQIDPFVAMLITATVFLVPGLFSICYYMVYVPIKDREALSHKSVILNAGIRQWYFDKIRPFLEYFTNNKINPNFLTLLGFLLSFLAGLSFAMGQIYAGGWLVLLSGTFDMIDGHIARKTGQVTKHGGYFDSVLDRYAEFIIFVGLMIYFSDSWMLYVTILTFLGAQMVSYTRAKADVAGVDCSKIGIMQRPERYVYLGFGAIFSGLFRALLTSVMADPKQYILMFIIAFIGVWSNITAIKRFRFVYLKLREKD